MKKSVLLLFFLITFFYWSQDKIVYKDGREDIVKVVEIGKTELKYKKLNNLEGPSFVCLKTELVSVQFANGTFENFIDENNNLNDKDLLKYTAVKDARRYYKGYRKGLYVTLTSSVLLTPIGGVIFAKKYANEEFNMEDLPRLIKKRGINGTMFVDNPYINNDIYKENFKDSAKKMKKSKIWKGFVGGTLIDCGIAGLTTIII